ncbi:TLC domain-containing protein 5 [Sardina pilchardus]|uniref:TLC domain-containing protein 5 n=1 Tax=Sardina pilchardus TaxID=27697 RepID=UPI002E0D9DDB
MGTALLVAGFSCSLIGWVFVYAFICYVNAPRGYEWNCRLVTLFHGILIVLLTAYIAFIDGPWPFTHVGEENTPMQVLTVLISMGYFIFDMGWCMYFRTEGPVMLAHHVLSVMGMLLTLGLGESGTESCAVIFGSEITNPLLQTRWFLKRAGQYDTLAGDAVDVLFIFLFGLVRIGIGGFLLVAVVTSARTKLVIKAEGVAIYTLSWIFMVDITRFAIRKSCGKYRLWQERRIQNSVNGKAHQN